MSERIDPSETKKDVALQDLFTSLAAVAQAGMENGQSDVAALDLPDETVTRAGEIYRQGTVEK